MAAAPETMRDDERFIARGYQHWMTSVLPLRTSIGLNQFAGISLRVLRAGTAPAKRVGLRHVVFVKKFAATCVPAISCERKMKQRGCDQNTTAKGYYA
jgi:hypothetical protein